jgi:hypothetical protein
MALAIDTHRALRTIDEQHQLLAAILAAQPADESEAIEWKGPVDVTSRDVMVAVVARNILGMSNRLPDVAAQQFDGCGYLVLGLEPGQVHGVEPMDPADVSDVLSGYLGAQPRYRWTNLSMQGHTVVVVTVEAPRWGDDIGTLQKEWSTRRGATYRAGTIFVRRSGKTEQAGPSDVAALVARAGGAAARLVLALSWQQPVPAIPSVSDRPEDFAAWARGEKAAMLAAAHKTLSPKEPAWVSQVLAVQASLVEPEKRTVDDFSRELDRWVDGVTDAGPQFIRDHTARQTTARPVPVLTNLTDANLEGVKVELSTVSAAPHGGAITGHLPDDDEVSLPPAPPTYGPKMRSLVPELFPLNYGGALRGLVPLPARVWVDNEPNARVEFAQVHPAPVRASPCRPSH